MVLTIKTYYTMRRSRGRENIVKETINSFASEQERILLMLKSNIILQQRKRIKNKEETMVLLGK